MGLRTTKLEAGRPEVSRTSREWTTLLQDVLARGAEAAKAGRPQTVAALFAEVAAWEDPQRVYQARRELTELVFALSGERAASWPQLYLAAARALVDTLE